ncbi:hypothetical protein HMPREF1595_00313, partial [Escherichia coli 907672]
FFHITEGNDEERLLTHWHFSDMEIIFSTKCLNTIIAIIRNFTLTKEIAFNTRHNILTPLFENNVTITNCLTGAMLSEFEFLHH